MYFETLDEGFFSKEEKNIKKNCLPIDLTKTYDWNIGRMLCINTHITNTLALALQNKKTIGKFFGISTVMSIIGGLLLGPVGTLAGLPLFLRTIHDIGYPLIRQWDARDFILISTNLDETNDNDYIINLNHMHLPQHPVVSCNDGEVIYTYNKMRNGQLCKTEDDPLEGNHVIINHYNGKFFSCYCHLYQNSITVKEGDKVKKGQVIGAIGHTGNSSMPHLHFDITYSSQQNKYAIGKKLTNFEDYMCTSIDMNNKDEDYWRKKLKAPLIKNKSGYLEDFCLIS